MEPPHQPERLQNALSTCFCGKERCGGGKLIDILMYTIQPQRGKKKCDITNEEKKEDRKIIEMQKKSCLGEGVKRRRKREKRERRD